MIYLELGILYICSKVEPLAARAGFPATACLFIGHTRPRRSNNTYKQGQLVMRWRSYKYEGNWPARKMHERLADLRIESDRVEEHRYVSAYRVKTPHIAFSPKLHLLPLHLSNSSGSLNRISHHNILRFAGPKALRRDVLHIQTRVPFRSIVVIYVSFAKPPLNKGDNPRIQRPSSL